MATAIAQPVVTKLDPWAHQLAAYRFAYDRQNSMLAMEMGTGKSKVVIDLIQNDPDPVTRTVLILCPKTVLSVWESELSKHCAVPYDLDLFGITLYRRKGGGSERLYFCVVNYERFYRGDLGVAIKKHQWDWLVLDESHKLKAPMGVASRAVRKISALRTLALTGTPMPHSPLDIWAQMQSISPDLYGKSYTRFRLYYAQYGGFQNRQVIAWLNQDELARKLSSVAFQVSKDVLDLPEYHHIERKCELSAKARIHYNELRDEFITEVEGGIITASNALVKLLRLQQLTGGWLADANVDTNKAELLLEVLDELSADEPVVIFARFRRDLDTIHQIAGELGRDSFELSGRINSLHQWQNGNRPILAVQIQSGGVGIDLTRARHAIYYSLGYSLGEYDQSLARLHRPGQKYPVTYTHLIAHRTVDDKVYKALRDKRDVVSAILAQIGSFE